MGALKRHRKLQLHFKLVCELYIVTKDLDLKILYLKCLCSSYLEANLTEVNVTTVMKLSQYKDISLKGECFKFIFKS